MTLAVIENLVELGISFSSPKSTVETIKQLTSEFSASPLTELELGKLADNLHRLKKGKNKGLSLIHI